MLDFCLKMRVLLCALLFVICSQIPSTLSDGDEEIEDVCHDECPLNQEWSKCGTPECQNTCTEPRKDQTIKCNCKPGCVCRAGYLKNSKGKCVPPDQCECPNIKTEIFMMCPPCENTCKNPKLSEGKCACKPHCVCRDGYFRNNGGVCVTKEDCFVCNENTELFSPCDNHPCLSTCEEPDLITRCSYAPGCFPGCICLPGFLRNAQNVCVPENTCVKPCGLNESYNNCGTACPQTCKNKDKPISCTKQCVKGCFCNDGYVRDDNNKCILTEQCPKPCGVNEIYDLCPPINCPPGMACPAVCTPACVCKPGFTRDKLGKCVAEVKSSPICGANECYDQCPPKLPAELTCKNYLKGQLGTHPSPCKAGCKCKAGFIRIGNACLSPQKCCTDPNSELVKSPNPCPGGTCKNPNYSLCDTKPNAFGCRCKKGFLMRDASNSTCLSTKDCCLI